MLPSLGRTARAQNSHLPDSRPGLTWCSPYVRPRLKVIIHKLHHKKQHSRLRHIIKLMSRMQVNLKC